MLAGRRALDGVAGIKVVDDWQKAQANGGAWLLRIEIRLQPGEGGGAVPAKTAWYINVDERYPAGMIDFLPAVEGGLPGFHPHQARGFPDISADRPWRNAKICVATTTENNLTNTADAEPETAGDRLAFQARRAVEWVRRASLGILLGPGEPFELPVFTMDADRARLAFREGPETFAEWAKVTQVYGLVDLVHVGAGARWLAAREYQSPGGSALVSPEWGFAVSRARSAGKGIWLRMSSVPVLPPWQAPITWGNSGTRPGTRGLTLTTPWRPPSRSRVNPEPASFSSGSRSRSGLGPAATGTTGCPPRSP